MRSSTRIFLYKRPEPTDEHLRIIEDAVAKLKSVMEAVKAHQGTRGTDKFALTPSELSSLRRLEKGLERDWTAKEVLEREG